MLFPSLRHGPLPTKLLLLLPGIIFCDCLNASLNRVAVQCLGCKGMKYCYMVTILLLGAEKLPGAWEQILLGMLAATAMEYAVHWGYERLFQVQFWDYSSTKCDVNGRICLPFSICWGILSMLAVRYVQPVLEGYAALLPEWAAALAVFLASARASYVTGQCIGVDGGLVKSV